MIVYSWTNDCKLSKCTLSMQVCILNYTKYQIQLGTNFKQGFKIIAQKIFPKRKTFAEERVHVCMYAYIHV